MALLSEVVVVNLYAESYCGGSAGKKICDYEGPVVEHESLDYEENASEAHQKESRHGDAIGVSCADSVNGLRHIAADHAYSCQISYNGDNHAVGFNGMVFCQIESRLRVDRRSRFIGLSFLMAFVKGT